MLYVKDLANQILTAVETCGKEGIMQLMQENPSLVKEILINLCDNDHLLHRVCILGDEELIVFLTAFTSDINAISPMVRMQSSELLHASLFSDNLLPRQRKLSR